MGGNEIRAVAVGYIELFNAISICEFTKYLFCVFGTYFEVKGLESFLN